MNNAEPCVLGNTSTRESSGRISSTFLPSGRILSTLIKRLTSLYKIVSNECCTCFKYAFLASSSITFNSPTSLMNTFSSK